MACRGSFRSEFRQKPLAHSIATAIAANVLTHEKNPLITNERIADRLAHRFAIAELQQFRSRPGVAASMRPSVALFRIYEARDVLHRLPCSRLGESYGLVNFGGNLSLDACQSSSGWIMWLDSSQPRKRTIGPFCRHASPSALSR